MTEPTAAGTPISLRLDGRVTIITGAAGLIGSELSRGFASNGATVVLVDRDLDGVDRVADSIDADTRVFRCDITDQADVELLVADVVNQFGRIDVLVNNAGGNRRRLPHELSMDDWRYLTELNLTACMTMCQQVGRQMIRRGRGSIVNISSTCGCSGMGRGNLAFSVAKAGVNHLTRELALEWGASGVRVNAIAPSQVDSPDMREWMAQAAGGDRTVGDTFLGGVPLGRLVRAQDIVGPALFLAGDAAAMVTGIVMPVDGGNLTANIAGTVGTAITL